MKPNIHTLSWLSLALCVGTLPLAAQKAPAAAKVSAKTAQKVGPALSAPVKGPTVEGITEYRLANGLKVLLIPDAAKPTITVNIVYLSGSRQENYGETGMAHILEHILFNGTKRYPGGMKELEALGAEFNGTTWLDRTHYYVTFKADEEKLHRALDLEADRMRHARVEQPILDKEMKIITNEWQMGENNPTGMLIQRTYATAYDWHAYSRSTIGAKSDIQNVKLEYVKAYYDRYYQPDNAVLVVAGRIDEAKVLQKIQALFGPIPRPSRKLIPTYTLDAPQDGERSATVRRAGGNPMVSIAYKVPAAAHMDTASLLAVMDMLTDTPNGRLHKALIDSKLATQVFGFGLGNAEPGLFQVVVTLPQNGDVEQVKAVLMAELEGIAQKPFTQAELDSTKQRIEKRNALQMADTKNLAVALTESIAAGDWRLFFLIRDQVAKATPVAASNVAKAYFKPSNRTLCTYIPTEQADRSDIPATPAVASLVATYKGREAMAKGEAFDATPAHVQARTQTFTAPNGLKGALLPKETKGNLVTAQLNLHFASEDALKALPITSAGLMASMLMRGSETRDRKAIQAAFDALKTQASVSGGATSLQASLTTTRENLAPALRLLAEVLRKPAFPATEFEGLVKEKITGIQAQMKEPQALASQWLQEAINVYPAGHPFAARSFDQLLQELGAAKAEEAKAFYTRVVGAEQATFACVGDHDAREVQALVTELFGDWKAATPYQDIPARMRMAPPERRQFETPDKQMAVYFAFQPLAMSQEHPDYPALALAAQLYGGGAKSRLFERLRGKENMSYGAGGQFNAHPRDEAGVWLGFAIFGPADRARMEAAAGEELQKAVAQGFTAEEFEEGRKVFLQTREAGRQEDAAIASWLNGCLHLKQPLDKPGELDAKVRALTLEQVNAAIRRHIDPSRTLFGVAGDFQAAKS